MVSILPYLSTPHLEAVGHATYFVRYSHIESQARKERPARWPRSARACAQAEEEAPEPEAKTMAMARKIGTWPVWPSTIRVQYQWNGRSLARDSKGPKAPD